MFDFNKVMAGKSDSELLQVVNDTSKYQHEAVNAAKIELAKRNLSTTKLEEATKTYLHNKEADESRANVPLDNHWKLLTLLFPAIFTVIMSGHLKGGGYDRKAKELATWTFYGFALYAAIIILANVI
jgi:hypothetical protein